MVDTWRNQLFPVASKDIKISKITSSEIKTFRNRSLKSVKIIPSTTNIILVVNLNLQGDDNIFFNRTFQLSAMSNDAKLIMVITK